MFEFIETPFFTKAISRYLEDDEYAKLQNYLNEQPEAGVIVPGSGGVRKLRWGFRGRGKRGGCGSYITCGALAANSGCSRSTERMCERTSPRTL